MHHKSACEAAQPCLLSVALNTLIVRGGIWDLNSVKSGLLRSRTESENLYTIVKVGVETSESSIFLVLFFGGLYHI